MIHSILRRSNKSRGHVLMEASFCLVSVFSLLIAAFDFGQFLYIHQALVERARTGARWGAINSPNDLTAIQNMVLYDAPTGSGAGYFGLTSSMVQVTKPDAANNNARIVIFITDYPYVIYSPFIAGSYRGPNITIAVPLGPPS